MKNPDNSENEGNGKVDPYARTGIMEAVQGEPLSKKAEKKVEKPEEVRPGKTAPQKPEESGEFFNVADVPLAENEISEIAKQLREAVRPEELTDVPGASVLNIVNIDMGGFWPLPEEWRVVHISVRDRNGAALKDICSTINRTNGSVISLPFNEPGKSEILAVFPDVHQAEDALHGLKSKYQRDLRAGMQKETREEEIDGVLGRTAKIRRSRVYGGIFQGTPCFIGEGVEEALKGSVRPHRPITESGAKLETGKIVSDGKKILQSIIQIPQSLTRVCAVMEIRIKDMTPSDRKRRMNNKILDIIDRKTDVFQWLGSKITIVSTRERAAAMLIIQMQEILKEFPEEDVQIAVSEGAFEIENLGESRRPPRALRGKVFREIRELAIPEDEKGIFVSLEGIERLDTPRGLKINMAVRTVKGAVKLVDVEDRTTEIMTGGPKNMLGRDAEMQIFVRNALEVIRKRKTKIMVLDGDPGIGKSRFMEESINFLNKREEDTDIVCSKANEYESTKAYTFIIRVIGEILRKHESQAKTQNYQILEYFVKGEDSPEGLKERVERLYTNPEGLADAMRRIISSSGNTFAMFLDDLQWCDSRSAIVVAAFIRQMGEDNRIFLQLSARSDYETMPLAIKRALGEKEKKAKHIHLKALPFMDRGAPTDLLRQYVSQSPPLSSAERVVIPDAFLANLGKASGGNPFAVTQILHDLASRKLLYIDDHGNLIIKERKINFENYTGTALYANRINRLSGGEQEVCKILSLFDGSLSMRLFRQLFPGQVQHAHALEDHGVVASRPRLHFSHDLLRKAAAKKFPKDPKLAWTIYTKVHSLENSPEFAEDITHTMQFGLVEPTLASVEKTETRAKDEIYRAGLIHGIEAVREMEGKQRLMEAYDTIRTILLTIPVRNIPVEQRFQCAWRLANISLKLGRVEALFKYIDRAYRIAVQCETLRGSWRTMLDLAVLRCDAMHLKRDWEGMRTALRSLSGTCAALMKKHESEPYSAEEYRKINAAQYLVELNRAREAYHRREVADALAACQSLIGKLEAIEQTDFQPPLMPLEYEAILLEARRFYVSLIGQKEEWEMSKYDDDVRFSQKPDKNRQKALEQALEAQRAVLDGYRSPRPLMRHPKDLISALTTLAKLMIFTGRPKGYAMQAFDEAAREASNFQEIAELTLVHQMRGDLLMSLHDVKTNAKRTEEATEFYRRGMAEIAQLGKGGDRHSYYALNACNYARALAVQVESFGGRGDADSKKKIKEGFDLASKALEILGGDKAAVYQYIFPTIGKLWALANMHGMQDEIEMPEGITSEDAAEASSLLKKIYGKADDEMAEECVISELQWKLEGLRELRRHFMR